MKMAFELIYTSAPQGIRQGSSGFCVVACTKGMGAGLIAKLENLSAYKPVYPHYDPNAWENPVSCSHCVVGGGGGSYHVLSRICFNGLDYTKRSNKLASHIVLSENEMNALASGPAAPFFQTGLFREESWEIKSELYDRQVDILASNLPAGKCAAWERFTGDAGWGGVLAEHFLASPQGTACVLFDPLRHKKLIELVQESILLLPRQMRWSVTFNTYFTTLPAGINCNWRFLPAGQEAERMIRRIPGALVIDLTCELPPADGGALVTTARTGVARREVPVERQVPVERSVSVPVRPPVAGAVPDRQTGNFRTTEEKTIAVRASQRRPAAGPAVLVNFGGNPSAARGNRIKICAVVILLLAFLGGGFFFVHAQAAARKYRETGEALRVEYAEYQEYFKRLETLCALPEETPLHADIEDLSERIRNAGGSEQEKSILVGDIAARAERFRKNLELLKSLVKNCSDAVSGVSNFQLHADIEDFDLRYEAYRLESARRGEADPVAGAGEAPLIFSGELTRVRQLAEEHLETLKTAVEQHEEQLGRLDELRRELESSPATPAPSEPAPAPEKEVPAEESLPEEPAIPPKFAWMYAGRFSELSPGNPVTFLLAVDPGSTLDGLYGKGVPSDGSTVRMTTDSGNEILLTAELKERRLTFEIQGGRIPDKSQIYVRLQPENSVCFFFNPGFSQLKFVGENRLKAEWTDSGNLRLTYRGMPDKVPKEPLQIALRSGGIISGLVTLTSGRPEFVFSAKEIDSVVPGYRRQIARVNELDIAVKKLREYIPGQFDRLAAMGGVEKYGFSLEKYKQLSQSIKEVTAQLEELRITIPDEKARRDRERERENKMKERDKLQEELRQETEKIIEGILKRSDSVQLRNMFGVNELFVLFSDGPVDEVLDSARKTLLEMQKKMLSFLKRPEIVLMGDHYYPQITVELIE